MLDVTCMSELHRKILTLISKFRNFINLLTNSHLSSNIFHSLKLHR